MNHQKYTLIQTHMLIWSPTPRWMKTRNLNPIWRIPYSSQIPQHMKAYITGIFDPLADGNCGF
ncbi:hypothetical protein PSHT_10697 [Puccinia striiformis]|uniref:Uncharacterized protein n=1 Tax=Puccinia striiformis TaxID=27350 RepID=A0A2S4V889_9BASI|nr:hypothetical protein PSHT_10697 [Puccinia striiformis]